MSTTLIQLGMRDRTVLAEARRRAGSEPGFLAAVFSVAERSSGVEAVAVLSTCERVEIYAISRTGEVPFEVIESVAVGCPFGVERRIGAAAVQHLFSIAAGLDSRLIGEPHVLGQVSQMPIRGQLAGAKLLHRLKQDAIGAARQIRRSTGLERLSVSCVDLALARTLAAADAPVVIVGSGALAREFVQRLSGIRPLVLVARHTDRVSQAGLLEVAPLSELGAVVSRAGVVISATSAVEPIIRQEHISERARRGKGAEPLLLLDLGMPPNCDVIRATAGLTLVDLDDLTAGREQPREVVHEARARAESRAASWAARWLTGSVSNALHDSSTRSQVA